VEDLSKHSSQVDAAKGFGGRFGVQKDRVDKVQHRSSMVILTYIKIIYVKQKYNCILASLP
jgi:hypothetical protein